MGGSIRRSVLVANGAVTDDPIGCSIGGPIAIGNAIWRTLVITIRDDTIGRSIGNQAIRGTIGRDTICGSICYSVG